MPKQLKLKNNNDDSESKEHFLDRCFWNNTHHWTVEEPMIIVYDCKEDRDNAPNRLDNPPPFVVWSYTKAKNYLATLVSEEDDNGFS